MNIEIPQRRTYNQKHFTSGYGSFTMEAHAGHIHYKNEDGSFADSDISFVDMGTYWEMTKHNYHLKVLKDFSAPTLIEYKNVWEGNNHTITYDPVKLVWVNATDLSDIVVFRNQQSVQGVLDGGVIDAQVNSLKEAEKASLKTVLTSVVGVTSVI